MDYKIISRVEVWVRALGCTHPELGLLSCGDSVYRRSAVIPGLHYSPAWDHLCHRDVNPPGERRTWSGEQQFDPNGGVARGYLAVKGYQRGVASLGKSCQVVIGPQLVALVGTRRDRTPDRIQFGWLICP